VFLGLLLLSLVAAACFVYLFRDELVASMQVLPTGSVLRGRWGAQVLPLGIHWLVEGVPAGGINSTKNMTLPLAGLFMAAFALAIRYARNPVFGPGFLALPPWPRSLLISGALLIVGCFVAWQNLPYRGIFFLLVLPGILMLRSVGAGGDRPMAAMPAAILYLMWQGPVSQGILHGMLFLGLSHAAIVVVQLAIWALTQMIWWWVVILLMTLLCAGLVFPFISRAREPRAPAVTPTGASTPHG
jgi:hypothetical protein